MSESCFQIVQGETVRFRVVLTTNDGSGEQPVDLSDPGYLVIAALKLSDGTVIAIDIAKVDPQTGADKGAFWLGGNAPGQQTITWTPGRATLGIGTTSPSGARQRWPSHPVEILPANPVESLP